MKRLPIGISDFKQLKEGNYYYVDKTLLIKDVLDYGNAVVLLPRPRRFGKTLNLSMLYYFFSNYEHAGHLFKDTAIQQHPAMVSHQGNYPVIFITFKDVKVPAWEDAYAKIRDIISDVFLKNYAAVSSALSEYEQILWSSIANKTAQKNEFENSLKFASEILQRQYRQKTVILLDEYDAPIHAAYRYGYYQEMVAFIRNLLSGALKDNTALAFSIMTGILRTAKEGIFSGLNNLKVYTLLHEPFSTYFGFTQSEVGELLNAYDLQSKGVGIQDWYNGYQFAGTTIYNPWSVLNCVQDKGLLGLYWTNTSDNALIKKLLVHASPELHMQLEALLTGESTRQRIEEAFIFPNMESNELIIWSLLVFSGYLTAKKQELVLARFMCDLVIPNQEIKILYEDLLQEILSHPLQLTGIRMLLKALEQGDGRTFEKIVQEYLVNSISMFDLPNNEPERSYHLFVLGLLVILSEHYKIRSNRESGYGRYDIMLIPKDIRKPSIIIEFKKADKQENLTDASQQALHQIHNKGYSTELQAQGITNIVLWGIAFKGKKVLLIQE